MAVLPLNHMPTVQRIGIAEHHVPLLQMKIRSVHLVDHLPILHQCHLNLRMPMPGKCSEFIVCNTLFTHQYRKCKVPVRLNFPLIPVCLYLHPFPFPVKCQNLNIVHIFFKIFLEIHLIYTL